MNKNKLSYFLLLSLFLILIFISNINNFLITINPNLNNDIIIKEIDNSILNDYNELLKANQLKITNINLIISKVKYRNIYNFSDTLTIYKGFLDGINTGDAVITSAGLIGVITKTYEHSSIVKLITNKTSTISVKIGDCYGILKSENSRLVVTNISNYDEIKENDKIYTSGIGNLPGDIYIGKVRSITYNNSSIEKIIIVSDYPNLNTLNYLYVVQYA